ncbi:hypothetical protein [Nocardia sp. CA-119907]|uniref:hypothetical protein n=1 Tax=Nocardia sp. CA-119907 TaxID=3239973 RepID=UPI003D96B492
MTDSDDKAPGAASGPAQSDGKPAGSENPQPPLKVANSEDLAERQSGHDSPESVATTETNDHSADSPPEHDSERSSGKRTVYFTQTINGTVHAAGARFGISDAPETLGPLTGKLNASDIANLTVGYVRPEPFGTAFKALEQVHAIVLEGPSGTGKRAGATMLLHELATGPLESLPPTTSIEKLATYQYKAGQGYLVTDSHYTELNRPDLLAASFLEEDVGHAQAVSDRAA